LKRLPSYGLNDNPMSPSPRKAWIETLSLHLFLLNYKVAFPPEGVD